jgi:hypothetical protein
MTGTHRSLIANRLSHVLGLRVPGPAMDRGQSSSLVTVHLTDASPAAGECALALVGGVSARPLLDRHSRPPCLHRRADGGMAHPRAYEQAQGEI